MSKPVITVENLSKAYRIGLKEEIPDTLVSAMSGLMKAPFRKFRELRKLDTFGHSGAEEEDIYWALKDVSFEVQEGEVLGVIGRNGAGKSTLLKILSRITEPTRGRAVIRGRVSSLLEVGTGFHPELSGRENVYLNGTILGMTKREIDRKFDEIVDFSGIEKFLDTPIKRYSSGMKVRLAFAVAAHLEPEILIIDEVLAVGDAEFQKKCMGKMQDVARGGRTVLFVSHDMSAIEVLCSRAMVLVRGASANCSAPRQAIASYLSDAAEQTDGVFDLRASPARKPGTVPVIMRISLYSSGMPTSSIPSCSPLTIQVQTVATEPIRNARVALAIEDAIGRRITTVANYFHSSDPIDLSGENSIECLIDTLSLGPGRYLLSASVATKEGGLIDSIDHAAWFEVDWRHRFGVVEHYSPIYGPVVTDSTWNRV